MKGKKRIVFARLGGVGDVVHTLPLVKYLRKKYLDASIEYITSSNVTELLSNCCPYVDKVWTFEKNKKKLLADEILNFGDQGKVDYFFNLHTSLSFFFFNLFYLKSKRFFQYKKQNKLHAVLNFARTYDKKISIFNLDYKTLFVDGDNNLLNNYGLKEGKYVCFVLGVGKERMHRAWPLDKWLCLTEKHLSSGSEYKVVFLGGEDEEGLLVADKNIFLNKQIVNLINKLNLVEVANVIYKSKLVVCCDTGLLHIASALSKRVIGLFGPTSPKRSGPFTDNCFIVSAKDCECARSFMEFKKCRKKDFQSAGFCMNNLLTEEVLLNLSLPNLVNSPT